MTKFTHTAALQPASTADTTAEMDNGAGLPLTCVNLTLVLCAYHHEAWLAGQCDPAGR
jgi:hypothetical protein